MQFRSGFRVGFCAVRMAFQFAVNLRIAAQSEQSLEVFLFVESIVLLRRNVFSNVFFVVAFAIFRSCFIAAWGLLRFYFYCAFFCIEIASLSAIFLPLQSR